MGILFTLLAALALACSASAQVVDSTDAYTADDPVTVPFNSISPALTIGGIDLPYLLEGPSDYRLLPQPFQQLPDQISIVYNAANQVTITWTTGVPHQWLGHNTSYGTPAEYGFHAPDVAAPPITCVYFSKDAAAFNAVPYAGGEWANTTTALYYNQTYNYSYVLGGPPTAEGRPPCFGGPDPALARCYDPAIFNYTSGLIHRMTLSGLQPSTTYHYMVGDWSLPSGTSGPHTFTMPPAVGAYPLRLGVMADLGQSYNSSETLEHMLLSAAQVGVLVGDFAYADHYQPDLDARVDDVWSVSVSYQPRWDAFGRLLQPLSLQLPFIFAQGNHELEPLTDGITGPNATSFYARYAASLRNVSTTSSQNLYWSTDVGPAHVIVLTAYDGYNSTDPQYAWLQADLATHAPRRTLVPWLIVMIHTPWYNTYAAHFKEAECVRLSLEPMLIAAGVDMLLAGHVHAYERSNRVNDYRVDACGIHHFTIGDGGNVEALKTAFVNGTGWANGTSTPACTQLTNFSNSGLNGLCHTYQAADEYSFCPLKQPAWSAFREPSFGHATLDLLNATHAVWAWHRNQDPEWVVADQKYIVRQLWCANQGGPGSPPPRPAAPAAAAVQDDAGGRAAPTTRRLLALSLLLAMLLGVLRTA